LRTLVIDTATAACSVALIDDGAVVARMHEIVGRGHAERLVPMIATLPGGGRADRIAVDCGPGSFTGVRVGLAAARGLALGWDVPVHGFSSLALIAVAGLRARRCDRIVAVVEGGHGEVFMQGFTVASATTAVAAIDVLVSHKPDAAIAALGGLPACGNGAARLRAADAGIDAIDALPDAADWPLLPPALAELPPRPIYGREPDARVPGASAG
jgi:tRNA threonylcarbamoyl adenosine modification protein YeaZ